MTNNVSYSNAACERKASDKKTTTKEQKIVESENDTLVFRDHTSTIKYLVL